MPSVARLSLLLAIAALQATSTPVPPPSTAPEPTSAAVVEHDCGFQGMTHVFGGIRCYAQATAFCSDVLIATRHTTKTLTLAPSTSTTTLSPSSNSRPAAPPAQYQQQPLITPAPAPLRKRDYLYDEQDEVLYMEVAAAEEDGEADGFDIGLYNPLNCPDSTALAQRADIKLECACLMNRGPSTLTVTVTATVTPSVVLVTVTPPPIMPKIKANEDKRKIKTKTQQLDAPLRKGVYGAAEKDWRPFGHGAEPVPFWDKDDGFEHRRGHN